MPVDSIGTLDISKVPDEPCFCCGNPELNIYFVEGTAVGVRCSSCDLLAVVLHSMMPCMVVNHESDTRA
jgi:hypothetical protein